MPVELRQIRHCFRQCRSCKLSRCMPALSEVPTLDISGLLYKSVADNRSCETVPLRLLDTKWGEAAGGRHYQGISQLDQTKWVGRSCSLLKITSLSLSCLSCIQIFCLSDYPCIQWHNTWSRINKICGLGTKYLPKILFFSLSSFAFDHSVIAWSSGRWKFMLDLVLCLCYS